jgi:predicted nucleotidyltransferase
MLEFIEKNKEKIHSILKSHSVTKAELFGSAVRDDFNDESDIDFLITFSDEIHLLDYADNYFALKEALESLFGRNVDVVSSKSLKNPVLIEEINKSKRRVYAA